MTNVNIELGQLRQAILEIMSLAKTQLEKSKDAFLTKNKEIAIDIIEIEKVVNTMELDIDRRCENIIALFQPVATDLRYVISMLKINSDIERIADYADGIADYVLDLEKNIKQDALVETNLAEMFDITISMLADISTAVEKGDTVLAKKVYDKDSELNEINSNASRTIREFIKKNPEEIRPLLFLFSTIRKLERVGDHIKNIAENIIFYIEAEILKHKDDKLKN